MKYRWNLLKNAVGTVFLLAGAFFVCSTLVSIRAVFADPIAPMVEVQTTPVASPRSNSSVRANARANSRTNANARTTTASGRAVTNRATTARTATETAGTSTARTTTSAAARAGASRGTVTARTTATNSSARATTARSVSSRETTSSRVANTARNVRARTASTAAAAGTGAARVSLQGSAIRGSKAATSYTYLQSKLYTGNYSNIIDSTTGLISADAYSNCLDSYYACMDEICTARSAEKGRCSCAGRAQAFIDAQAQLERANEELIQVVGELTLLEATKGKDVSAAFQLTDAEKVMNCVSWKEALSKSSGVGTFECSSNTENCTQDLYMQEWCYAHGMYESGKCSKTVKPPYCSSNGNNFGFNIDDLITGSSILGTLTSYSNAIDAANSALNTDNNNLAKKFGMTSNVVSNMGLSISTDTGNTDSIKNKWGYDLFQFAHNNVCGRVLDSCFNGIYEACGNPPGYEEDNKSVSGRCATAGKTGSMTTQCPYNYNSVISVKDGDIVLVDRSTSNTNSATASCFGYTTTTTSSSSSAYTYTSTDPYATLRGPVADARRSVMNKYLLEANAACDVYGEQLRATAQNISYQKIAAQQQLQQMRQKYYQEEQETIANDILTAKQNYMACLDEIQTCRSDLYNTYHNQGWSTNRIKSQCNTMSEASSCYEVMVCDQMATQVIDSDKAAASNGTLSQNTVVLAEILGSGTDTPRMACLAADINVKEIRNWGTDANTNESCVPQNGLTGYRTWDTNTNAWGNCQATQCKTGYHIARVNNDLVCALPDNAEYVDGATVGPFSPAANTRCKTGFVASGATCVAAQCPDKSVYDTSCVSAGAQDTVGGCVKVGCKCSSNAKVNDGECALDVDGE